MGKSTTKRVGSHYVLDDVLGRGSMGTVWRGHDLNDGSPCAIKILNPTLTTDKGATRRFIDERDIFMSVDDDAVVRVTDMVVESSTFAIVMELVDGPDLAQVLKSLPDHRLDQGTAVSLGIEVCQALAAIHRVGIRHLDIKPANILIEDPENVSGARITDFGVSEVVAFHGPREVVGTPYYQAPEVAAGWTPTAASDLYSFGVTLYEILAGHMPFQANSAGNLLRNQPPPAIPGVDPRLWNTILTCLAPDPSQRPDSAEVLASELRSWRNGEQPVRLVSRRSQPVRPTPQPMPRPRPVRSAPSAISGATPPGTVGDICRYTTARQWVGYCSVSCAGTGWSRGVLLRQGDARISFGCRSSTNPGTNLYLYARGQANANCDGSCHGDNDEFSHTDPASWRGGGVWTRGLDRKSSHHLSSGIGSGAVCASKPSGKLRH